MDNPQDVKKALLATLAEKGDYATILKHLDTDEKKEKGDKMYKLIEPISAFADLLTQNNEGAFMEKLTARMDGTTKEALEKLTQDIDTLRSELQEATSTLLDTTKADLVTEHLSRYQAAESALTNKMMELAVEVVTNKANELLPGLYEGARLTPEEIDEIIEASALSVESQMAAIVGEYITEAGISVSQIKGFSEAVRKLLPEPQQVSWDSIVGKPDLSQGGTNANLIRQMISSALAGFTPGGGIQTIQAGTGITVDATDPANPIVSATGGAGLGDVVGPASAVDSNFAAFDTTTGKLIKDSGAKTSDFATAAQGTLATNAIPSSQKGVANGVAELDAGGLVPASQLPSFVDDVIEVANFAALPVTGETGKIYVTLDTNLTYRWSGSAYVEISASLALGETSSTAYRGDRGKEAYDLRHDAVTVSGTPNYITLVGQDIVRALINLTSHVTGLLPFANLADGTGLSVLGRSANTTGVQAPIVAATNHHVLRRSGTTIGFGAVNLAQANATTGSLPVSRGGTGAGTHTSGNYLKGNGTSAIQSVNAATLKTELALNNVDNTSDANKPVSTAQQTALDLKQTTTDAYLLTSEASSTTPTITGTALRNDYVATALVDNATLAAPSGTANASAVLRYRITASGGTRTIGYNAGLLAGNVTRTTSLAAGETLTQIYQRVGSTWVCTFEDII